MEPAPTQSGVRLSSLALAGIIVLSLLFGCMFGSLLGGAGGFLGGRAAQQRTVAGLQQQVATLESQARQGQGQRTTPAAPGGAAPSGQATPRATAPAAGGAAPTRPAQGGAAPGAQATPAAPARPATVFLGVRYNILNPEIAAQAGVTITNGALIGEVVPASPAEAAGLQPGDIITDIDGKPLTESFTLADAVASKKPGDALKMKVFRDGKTVELTATLVAPPAGGLNTPAPGPGAPGGAPQATPRAPGTVPGATPRAPGALPQATPRAPGGSPPAAPTRPPGAVAPGGGNPAPGGPSSTAPTGLRAYLGVMVAPTTAEAAKAQGLTSTAGVVIEQVVPSSPAFQAGLFDGDVILAVDGKAIDEAHPLTVLVAAKKPGDKTHFRVVRDGQEQDVVITLGATTREFNEARPGTP